MPDDFQALPPPVPQTPPPAYEDRYAEVNLRKPEKATSGWWILPMRITVGTVLGTVATWSYESPFLTAVGGLLGARVGILVQWLFPYQIRQTKGART